MTLGFVVLSPFLLAAVLTAIRWKGRSHVGWWVAWLPLILFVSLLTYSPAVIQGDQVVEQYPWIPSMDLHLVFLLDGLSFLFALLITGIGALVFIYSIFYLSKQERDLKSFYVYLLLFMGAMLGLVLSDHLLALYGFWELTSLSSFLLIGYWHHRRPSREGAMKSLLITVAGGFALLAGLLWLAHLSGTTSIREIIALSDNWLTHPTSGILLLLILIGAFTKSAQFPFYSWLPDAMEAPTPVSAYLHSATMVKAGLYLLARLFPAFSQHELWFYLVTITGLGTMLWAAVLAIRQTDLKAILAYSTVSQLGLIMALLGYGTTAAVSAAMAHIISHATFKGSLFMTVGIVDHQTGTRQIFRLGGLARFLPLTAAIAFVGVLSSSGIPPLNGYVSKEMFLQATWEVADGHGGWFYLFPLVALVGSVCTLVYSLMLFIKTFGGKPSPHLAGQPREASPGMWLPALILAVLVILGGLLPKPWGDALVLPAAQAVLDQAVDVELSLWHGWNKAAFTTLAIFALGAALIRKLPQLLTWYGKIPHRYTWNFLFRRFVEGLENLPRGLMLPVQRGTLNFYLAILFAMLTAGGLGYLLYGKGLHLPDVQFHAVETHEWFMILWIVLALLLLPFLRSRLSMLVATGAVGYAVVLFFVDFRAPDLALTQLIVETITVILFLIGFAKLPQLSARPLPWGMKLRNLLIASLVGVTMASFALAAQSQRLLPSISQYYAQHSLDLAGGRNIVNVILVDFRGLDTLFEILVLAVAALGIYSLILLRNKEKHVAGKGEQK